ncbi:MAG: sulfatase-like hydrolase/transferase, partial [Bacteroidales bacterium]|nr:sulfatase-like hydrolase/transferase [Bacteroidales bacterium]
MSKLLIPGGLALISLLNPSCKRSPDSMQSAESPEKPNVLIIITDDQGWGDIHSHGNDTISTPNIDKLASQSFRFDRFYVSPVCAPTRASLLTGRYHLRTGVHGVTGRREIMRNSELTIAELFRSEDYTTSYFGKWHNGADYPHNPNGQGFNHFFGFSAGHWNNYFDTKLEWNGRMMDTQGFITDVLTDSVIAEIEKNKNTSFFQVVSYNVPHSPFQVPDKYFEKYRNKGLDDETSCVYGMIENVDENIGRILKTIEDAGIADKTLILFLTDNGPNTWRFNGGLKGKKGWVDEGGVKVPCFLRVPWLCTGEIHIPILAAHIDILPTLASISGIDLPVGLPIDGVNLLPV